MNLAIRRGEKADQPCYFKRQIPLLKLTAMAKQNFKRILINRIPCKNTFGVKKVCPNKVESYQEVNA